MLVSISFKGVLLLFGFEKKTIKLLIFETAKNNQAPSVRRRKVMFVTQTLQLHAMQTLQMEGWLKSVIKLLFM